MKRSQRGTQADTVPDTGPGGGLGGTAVLNVLKDIRGLLEQGAGGGEGGSGLLDLIGKFTGKGKQTGGFVYKAPIQAFQQGGGVFKVPGNSTGDNHNMLLPQGSFVLNRNASEVLESGGMTPTPGPLEYQDGGMVPTKVESQEMIFGPKSFSSLIPILNDLVPRFQKGGVVEHLHGDPTRTKGYDKAGHGTEDNAHDHFAFSSKELRLQVEEMLASGQTQSGRTYEIGSTTGGKHADTSYHYSGQAFDIPWHQFGSGPIR